MPYQNHLLSLLKNWSAALRNDAEDDLNTKHKCLMLEMVCVCVQGRAESFGGAGAQI